MTTKQIDCILELAKTLNFNHAAENLYISQPTMTYQIRSAEEEIGFQIFERSGKGATLTPAGFQFCLNLRNIQAELRDAIEQGQNFSAQYREDISIDMSVRSALYKLPEAIVAFNKEYPDISITPHFGMESSLEAFQRGDTDIHFDVLENVNRVPDINVYSLYKSRFCLVTRYDDPLASKKEVALEDLRGRTLMIGGGSPPKLRALQDRAVRTLGLEHFNSATRDTSYTYIASGRGICLATGFLEEPDPMFAWIPLAVEDHFDCVLCTHKV